MEVKHQFVLSAILICAIGILAALIFTNSNQTGIRYGFKVEWMDPVSNTTRKFLLGYYPKNHSVEMYDLQNQKIFLKRVQAQEVEAKELYVGNTVVILSRQLKIVDYADEETRNKISQQRHNTFAMIKPDAVHRIGEIIDLIYSKGFEITQMRMTQLSRNLAAEFYIEHQGKSYFESLLNYMTSGPVIALELLGTRMVERWREALGPTDSETARQDAPDTVRAKFGQDKQYNAAHGSDSDMSAKRELNFFFYSPRKVEPLPPTAKFAINTCCIIKPHAVVSGKMGGILTAISQEGYAISDLQMFRITKTQAEEFLEVYQDVVKEYPGMVQQLISGPLVAMEITSDSTEKIVQHFREFVGPADPSIALELRPTSLRARFGLDLIRNAVHCSDLPEDGPLEVEYFCKILR